MSSSRPADSSRGPLAPALGEARGLRAVTVISLLSVGQAAALIGFADGLSRGLVSLLDGAPATTPLLLALLAAAARSVIGWSIQREAAAAAAGVKEALRDSLADTLIAGGGALPESEGKLTIAATRSLDELDEYFAEVLPAVLTSAAVPALLIGRFLFADWISALILVLCLPLVPVFMVLIGQHTQDRVARATASLDRLSHHLVELVRGLPVLIGLGRARAQRSALRRLAEDERTATMATLRVAFLSSLALELIASISVAIVAVFIGFRLVSGDLPLQIGLMVLVLAPECFAPLRRLGAAYHSSENGMAAWQRMRELIAADLPSPSPSAVAGDRIGAAGLVFAHEGRDRPALAGVDFEVEPGEHLVITGASGTGKTTLLGLLSGQLRAAEGARWEGSLRVPDPERMAWVAQSPRFASRTAREELSAFAPAGLAPEREREVLGSVGLTSAQALAPIAAMSPGEQRRLAVARALLRVDAGATVMLLDEPTAHLDAASADAVLAAIAARPRGVTVISASHDPRLLAEGDRTLRLGVGTTPAPMSASEAEALRPPGDRAELDDAVVDDAAPPLRLGRRLLELRAILGPWSARFLVAALAGLGSAAAGVALTALSAWLIVQASYQPPIMTLLVAIVGVRFFGLARAVLRYAERLQLHDALLRALGTLRLRLWDGLAAQGPSHRDLLRGPVALRRLIADVDDVQELAPRAVHPPVVAILMIGAATFTAGLIAPAAAFVVILIAGSAFVLGAVLVLLADARSGVLAQRLRAEVLERTAAFLGALGDLSANGVAGSVRAEIGRLDARAGGAARRSLSVQAAGAGLAVLLCLGGSIAMVWVLAPAHGRGLDLSLVAVCAFLPMALLDVISEGLRSVQLWPRLGRALDAVGHAAERPTRTRGEPRSDPDRPIAELELREAGVRWPGARTAALSEVSLRVRAGEWLTVTGPSGSGKTTLIGVLLRFLDLDRGEHLINGLDASSLSPDDLAGRIAWCPQEAHVFDSSLRANLLISRSPEDAPGEAELRAALAEAGLEDLLEHLDLDRPLGPGGSRLSGGQRQRVAVARTLLTGAEAIILDEPTAHLDDETASAMMARIREGGALSSRSRLRILVTHDPRRIASGDLRLVL